MAPTAASPPTELVSQLQRCNTFLALSDVDALDLELRAQLADWSSVKRNGSTLRPSLLATRSHIAGVAGADGAHCTRCGARLGRVDDKTHYPVGAFVGLDCQGDVEGQTPPVQTSAGRALPRGRAIFRNPEDQSSNAAAAGTFTLVPLARLVESSLNPRQHVDAQKLQDLAASVKGVGIIEPLVVRTGRQGKLEVVAGARRLRAAHIAKLAEVPVIVRELTDAEALEVMVIENNQREDVNALEEASGYQALMKAEPKYRDRAVLAQKIGRSESYVHQRMKLLELVPHAKQALLDNEITAGHAILIARLDQKTQPEALKRCFEVDYSTPEREKHAISVRRLDGWIDENVRLKLDDVDTQQEFPEITAELSAGRTLVELSTSYSVTTTKKGEAAPLSPYDWKDLTGVKACPQAVKGFIAIGHNRGKVVTACVRSSGCKQHFPAQRSSSSPTSPSAAALQKKERERQQRAAAKRQEQTAICDRVAAKVIAAIGSKVKDVGRPQLLRVMNRILDSGSGTADNMTQTEAAFKAIFGHTINELCGKEGDKRIAALKPATFAGALTALLFLDEYESWRGSFDRAKPLLAALKIDLAKLQAQATAEHKADKTLSKKPTTIPVPHDVLETLAGHYSGDVIGDHKRSRLKSIAEYDGKQYAIVGDVGSGAGGYTEVSAHRLYPRAQWRGKTKTYGQATAGDVRGDLFYFGMAVHHGQDQYVLGDPVTFIVTKGAAKKRGKAA